MLGSDTDSHETRRYTAQDWEPPQQLQRERKLLRSFAAQRRPHRPLLRNHLSPLRDARRQLAPRLEPRQILA